MVKYVALFILVALIVFFGCSSPEMTKEGTTKTITEEKEPIIITQMAPSANQPPQCESEKFLKNNSKWIIEGTLDQLHLGTNREGEKITIATLTPAQYLRGDEFENTIELRIQGNCENGVCTNLNEDHPVFQQNTLFRFYIAEVAKRLWVVCANQGIIRVSQPS
ncbi:TPA: hypothetical protein HA241_04715 [Candidatus Woesearchaeota archaeon]|nr:hypothetical protein [Candidatus Woesearchaeota archaeon]